MLHLFGTVTKKLTSLKENLFIDTIIKQVVLKMDTLKLLLRIQGCSK